MILARKIVFAPKRPRGAGRKACLTAGKQAFLAALRAVLGRKATGKNFLSPTPFPFLPARAYFFRSRRRDFVQNEF